MKFERVSQFNKWMNKVDWRFTNSQLAREVGVSRERVRQVRKYFNKPEPKRKWSHRYTEGVKEL